MYKDKVEHKYSSGALRAAWKGIKSMSSINQRNSDSDRKPLKIEGINDDLPNTFKKKNCIQVVENMIFLKISLSLESPYLLTVILSSVRNVLKIY